MILCPSSLEFSIETVFLFTFPESLQPHSYTVTITFTFDLLIPCDDLVNVKQKFEADVISNLRCVSENTTCTASFDITECSGSERKKRATDGSNVEIVLEIMLLSDVTFDLVEYYATKQSKFSLCDVYVKHVRGPKCSCKENKTLVLRLIKGYLL